MFTPPGDLASDCCCRSHHCHGEVRGTISERVALILGKQTGSGRPSAPGSLVPTEEVHAAKPYAPRLLTMLSIGVSSCPPCASFVSPIGLRHTHPGKGNPQPPEPVQSLTCDSYGPVHVSFSFLVLMWLLAGWISLTFLNGEGP